MDIKEYLRILRRYWSVIVLLTIVGVGLGYATTFSFVNRHLPSMFSTEYESTATLFAATQNGTSVSEAYQNNLFSQERVVSYAALATSEQVAARAVDQLKAPISAGELRGRITATPEEKTVLLKVGVRDADPVQAQTYANAVADQLVSVVSELETSRRGGTPGAGAVVVDDANYPTKPIGLALWKRLALGGGIGLVLGVIIAICVGALDKRLRGREPVESATDSLTLGGLPVDPERRTADVVDLAGNGLYAERIRELRTNLRFATGPSGGRQPRVIAITSPQRGEGRTTTAIDLAAALAESGRSVVLVDGDLRAPALADRLPLNASMRAGSAERGLSTVLVGENQLPEVLIRNVPVGNHAIALLPAGPKAPRPGELLATDRASTVVQDLAKEFEYVVVDTPPLEPYSDAAIIGAASDGVLILARIRQTTTGALRRALQKLVAANVTLIGSAVTFEPVGVLARRRHSKQVSQDAEPATARATPEAGVSPDAQGGDDRTNAMPAPPGKLVASGSPPRSSRVPRGSK